MSRIYLENWLKKTEIDYYQMFILSWIPFNAWYMKMYYDFENRIDNDKEIIKKLKREDNPFRSKIINLLSNDTLAGKEFRENIYHLYQLLEQNTIPNQEKRISFSSLKTDDNTQREAIFTYDNKTFKFEYLYQQPRSTKRFKCQVTKADGSASGVIDLHTCTKEDIEQHADYIKQKPRVQQKILYGFDLINPHKPSTILASRATGRRVHKELYFINNTTLCSQFLIELLYQLRCKIFHGEIDPKPAYYDIYKYAYLIINPLLKTLD